MTFVGGQVYEFTTLLPRGPAIKTNLFGTTFFVLTGFHGVHVTVGILMLLSLTGMSFADGSPTTRRSRWRWWGCTGTSSTSCGSSSSRWCT